MKSEKSIPSLFQDDCHFHPCLSILLESFLKSPPALSSSVHTVHCIPFSYFVFTQKQQPDVFKEVKELPITLRTETHPGRFRATPSYS